MNNSKNLLIFLINNCIFIFLPITLFSQTPIQKWEFGRIANHLDKEFVHGYNVGVSREGNVYVSSAHEKQFPLMISVDSEGKELFYIDYPKPGAANFIYKIRTEANDIYKNTLNDLKEFYGIQSTWIDSTNTMFHAVLLYYNRSINGKTTNSLLDLNKSYNVFFHSLINSGYDELRQFISRSYIEEGDGLLMKVGVYQTTTNGKIVSTIDSFSLGSVHKDDFVSLPKPQALRWFTNTKKLGMIISSDTIIPTYKSIVQVRNSNIVTKVDAKFDQVVDVNPYLMQYFAGKRLRWKGFTNSSFGFVALYENIDDNNRNILIRYNSATQTFTSVPLDASVDCRSLCIDSIGALAIVGTKNVSGNNDFYLGYFNTLGELSEQSWGGDEYDRLNDCVFDTLGEIAVSGQKGNDLYLAKFTFNATSVSDKGANSVPSVFIHQGGYNSSTNELVVDNLPSGNTTIRMYTMQGTFVGTIYEGMILEGATYRFPIPSTTLSNGVYLIVLENNGITQTKQFIVVK